MEWPNDADGDVFRRLSESGFDFSEVVVTDYNGDFTSWPPMPEALSALRAMYGEIELYPPSQEFNGYAQFKVRGYLTYETVMSTQRAATDLLKTYGAVCESWGVFE